MRAGIVYVYYMFPAALNITQLQYGGKNDIYIAILNQSRDNSRSKKVLKQVGVEHNTEPQKLLHLYCALIPFKSFK